MLPGLDDEAEGLRGHDVNSLVADDHQDPGQVSSDDRDGVGADALRSGLLLEQHQLGDLVEMYAVLFGSGVEVVQLFERGFDRDVEDSRVFFTLPQVEHL